jgi:hypothetical protein
MSAFGGKADIARGILALTVKPREMTDPSAIGGAAIGAFLVLMFAAWPVLKVYVLITERRKKRTNGKLS